MDFHCKAWLLIGGMNDFIFGHYLVIQLLAPARLHFWCTRHCKTSPVDPEGFRGQVRPVLISFPALDIHTLPPKRVRVRLRTCANLHP